MTLVPLVPFDIPHHEDTVFAEQAKPDRIDFAIVLWAGVGWAWEGGAAVDAPSTPGLSVDVAAGSVLFDGVSHTSPAGSVDLLPDATNPRFALVGIDRLATLSYSRTGTTITMELDVDPTLQGWAIGESINVATNAAAANATEAVLTDVHSNGDGTGSIKYTNGSGTIASVSASGFVVHLGVWHGTIQTVGTEKPAFPPIPIYGAVMLASVFLPAATAQITVDYIVDKRVPHTPGGGGGGGAVISVNTQTGAVVLTAADVGAQAASGTLAALSALVTTPYGRSVLEVANPAALRTLLGLGAASTMAVGTGPGTVAAGNDARFVTVSAGTLFGADSPYFMNPARTAVQNAAALVQLITDAAAQGKKAVIPGYGPGSPLLVAPWALTIAGDRFIHIEGQGQNATVLQQVQNGTGAWTLPFDPGPGASQNYWGNINGNTSSGSIILEKLSLVGGHAQKPSPQDAEAGWALYGIGWRVGRRTKMRDVAISGFYRGVEFDGQHDHTHFESVDVGGCWDNVYFGPQSAVKDNTFMACNFSSASRSCIAIDPLGVLSGSSFYGCHLATAPYGIYIVGGAKPGTALMMQSNLFAETIWEGLGNFRIFCEDGDSRIDRTVFSMAQFHGLETGENANVNGSQHMYHCAQITGMGRAVSGVVTIDVTNATALPHGIAVGQYITINGDTDTLPPPGPTVNTVVDATFLAPYRVLTVTPGGGVGGSDRITAQGTNVTLAAQDNNATGFVARVGLFRAGEITKVTGTAEFNPDEVRSRDPAVGAYGYAAELFVDVNDIDGWDLYDSFVYNVRCRTSRHTDTRYVRMRTEAGSFFLAQAAGAITAAQKPSVVQFSGNNGDVAIGIASRASAGVVGGGQNTDPFPSTPGGVYVVAGDYVWVQDDGVATVRGAGAAVGGQVLAAGATGAAAALAAGTAPGTSDFVVGNALGPNTVKLT